MTPADEVPGTPGPARSRKQTRAFAIGAAAIAAAWYMVLSGWLRYTPGSPLTIDINVLFNSDSAAWIDWFAGDSGLARPSPLHALLNVVWRPMGRALFFLLHLVLPRDEARIAAARALVALVAAAGFGCIAALATVAGVSLFRRLLLLPVFLLFSSNVLVVAPEHWGLSFGLLCACGLVVWLDMPPRVKAIWLAILGVLTGGTTITNILYPGAALHRVLSPPRSGEWPFRPRTLAIAAVLAFTACSMVWVFRETIRQRMPKLTEHIAGYVHMRIWHDPARVAIDTLTGLVYPAVAPMPEVTHDGHSLSYQRYERSTWGWAQVVAAAAWIVLLGRCAWAVAPSPDARGYVLGLLAWIGFNFALNAVWGDELFLYSPHWSWCLAIVMLLGSRALSPAFLIACVVLIVPGQLETFYEIGRAVRSM